MHSRLEASPIDGTRRPVSLSGRIDLVCNSSISCAIIRLGNETKPVIYRQNCDIKRVLNGYYIPFMRSVWHHLICSILIVILILQMSHITGFSYEGNDHRPGKTNCEIIQPMLITDHRSSSDHDQEQKFNLETCPERFSVLIRTSFSDELVIHLVKNQRLISDTYFRTMKGQSDRLWATNFDNKLNGQVSRKSVDLPDWKKPSLTLVSEEDSDRTEQFLNLHNFTSNDEHCHYHGFSGDNLNSISAISVINSKLLSGLVTDGSRSFHLIADVPRSQTVIANPSAESGASNHAIFDWSTCRRFSEPKRRERRDTSIRRHRFLESMLENKVLHEPFQANSSSLYVELLVVHDHSQFVDNNRNASLIAERTMQIVNIMNAFYRQLNIFVALVGVVLWTEKDKIELTEDGDATLTNFLKYRYENLLPKYHHDNAQLITSTSFNGSVVGKALKGPICTHEHSGGVNTDHSHNPAIVAVTLAHELGHNLGMEHDEDEKCKCPDGKCIMSSSSSFVHPKHWSSCSVDYLEDSRKHGLLDCLSNEPVQIFGPVCGNGFVEEGEDCDIGEPIPYQGTSKSRHNKNSIRSSNNGATIDPNYALRNPCCDRSTCKFTTNSTCAQGPCCDLTKCSVFNANEAKVCRPKKTECDFEEFCDGSSEYCPRDTYYHDGLECGPSVSLLDGLVPSVDSANYNQSRAFCYQGRCSSHESQCQLLWGPSGTTSKDVCFEQNVHGNTSGNCGYNRVDKSFASCEMDNAACGMLHCVHNQISANDPNRKTGKLNYGFESASILTVSFFLMSNQAKIHCHGAIIDAGPGMRDPGLVPNGAACGEDKMCLEQRCVSVSEVLQRDWCPSDCNGNGICDNLGVCHCNDGTIGTSCYQFFGSNFHLSLMLYMIFFFGPLIGVIVMALNHYRGKIKMWWFLHNRMAALKNKAREPAHGHRRMAYDANGCKVSISEPIPLNQAHNSPPTTSAGELAFDPTSSDPWAETSYHSGPNGKPLGYRLEPIKTKPPPPPPVPDYNDNQKPLPPPPHHPGASSSAPSHTNEDLKPVRSAPPPPIPPHRR